MYNWRMLMWCYMWMLWKVTRRWFKNFIHNSVIIQWRYYYYLLKRQVGLIKYINEVQFSCKICSEYNRRNPTPAVVAVVLRLISRTWALHLIYHVSRLSAIGFVAFDSERFHTLCRSPCTAAQNIHSYFIISHFIILHFNNLASLNREG